MLSEKYPKDIVCSQIFTKKEEKKTSMKVQCETFGSYEGNFRRQTLSNLWRMFQKGS